METLPVSPQEQAKIDRSIFESKIAESTTLKPTVSFESLSADIGENYNWIHSASKENQQIFTEAISQIGEYQSKYMQDKGELPSALQTYVEFRKRIETDKTIDETDKAAVLLIDALLNGDLRNGELPLVLIEKPKKNNPYISAGLFNASTIEHDL